MRDKEKTFSAASLYNSPSVCSSTFLTDTVALMCPLSTFDFPGFVLRDMNADLLAQTETSLQYMQIIEKMASQKKLCPHLRCIELNYVIGPHSLYLMLMSKLE